MEEPKRYKIYKIVMLVVLTAFITFMITSIVLYTHFSDNEVGKFVLTNSNNTDIETEINKLKKVIDEYYLGEVNEEDLKEGAIKGYIEGLNDPYTEYITKEDMEDYLADTLGNFVGIGIYMVKNTQNNTIEVLSPIKNSPAQAAGILPGDIIKSINGVEYTGDEMSVAAAKIKGEEGSSVKLEIIRGTETLNFDIKREKIKVNQIEGKMLEDNIAYIEIPSFDEETANDFKSKWEELEKKNAKSLIIDLRNNGGGIVDEALEIADFMTEKDSVLLYEIDKNNNEKVRKSKNDPIINVPIIILTNENTASSSEILAGALKDLGKAKIVGTKTYGKGVIQQLIEFKDGSGIKITCEQYKTPNKNEINKVGISPDVEVELPETVENVLLVKEEEDTQLKKAIEILKSEN